MKAIQETAADGVHRRGQLHAHRIRSLVGEMARAAKLPSVSIAVADPEGLLFSGAVGYADLSNRRRATPEDQ